MNIDSALASEWLLVRPTAQEPLAVNAEIMQRRYDTAPVLPVQRSFLHGDESGTKMAETFD